MHLDKVQKFNLMFYAGAINARSIHYQLLPYLQNKLVSSGKLIIVIIQTSSFSDVYLLSCVPICIAIR